MIHELRIYRAAAGRLPDVLSRFEKHTLKIWQKHGIRQAGLPTRTGKPKCLSTRFSSGWPN